MVVGAPMLAIAAAERKGNTLRGFAEFHIKNGSSQGQKPAMTGLFVLLLLDNGDTSNVGAGVAHPQTDCRDRVPNFRVAAPTVSRSR